MRNLANLILTFGVLISCSESPETKFNKGGISFTCPKGWKITEEEAIEEQGYYLSIEKEGLSSSGLMTVSWVGNQLDRQEWINVYKEQLGNNIIYKNSNLVFAEPVEDEFNGIRTLAVKFTANIIGLKHEGILHVFYGNDKTISVLKQEAIEDKTKNEDGFEMMEKSFKTE